MPVSLLLLMASALQHGMRFSSAATARCAAYCVDPGQWNAAKQAAYHDAVARQVRARGGHGGSAAKLDAYADEAVANEYADKAAADDSRRSWHGKISFDNEAAITTASHACAICACRFDRRKQLEEHLAGKRHREAEAAASGHWAAFQAGSWHEPSLTEEEHEDIVTRAWSLDDFLLGLPSRSRSEGSGIAPHVTMSSLAPRKRLMLWRYLRELMPSRPLLPEVQSEPERRARPESRSTWTRTRTRTRTRHCESDRD